MAQIIGWISNLLFLIGGIYLCKKNVLGFYFQLFGNILYIWQSIILNNISLMWLSLILGIVNIYGIYEWNKKNKSSLNNAEIRYANAVCDFYEENN
ncbi:MAG: nicotinamide mononucleotide transporter [Patescibacteria group bacterium]|jgi:nicotinamide riboside transporter PnuC